LTLGWPMTQARHARTAAHPHRSGGARKPIPMGRFLLVSFVLALIVGLVIEACKTLSHFI
jgi:hypothetical protein